MRNGRSDRARASSSCAAVKPYPGRWSEHLRRTAQSGEWVGATLPSHRRGGKAVIGQALAFHANRTGSLAEPGRTLARWAAVDSPHGSDDARSELEHRAWHCRRAALIGEGRQAQSYVQSLRLERKAVCLSCHSRWQRCRFAVPAEIECCPPVRHDGRDLFRWAGDGKDRGGMAQAILTVTVSKIKLRSLTKGSRRLQWVTEYGAAPRTSGACNWRRRWSRRCASATTCPPTK